ncbi:hypothetical protein FUAX_34110 [Fulvitalea axinellae]|uniref:Uncharacterized protein n=1 Tax=Fulvitalea axinellae TaxID=1182444 RepID=A0AAU9CFN5_9BACT|nr:hypothetical protein FUAX_34110 [Fulvitalea axinellae]
MTTERSIKNNEGYCHFLDSGIVFTATPDATNYLSEFKAERKSRYMAMVVPALLCLSAAILAVSVYLKKDGKVMYTALTMFFGLLLEIIISVFVIKRETPKIKKASVIDIEIKRGISKRTFVLIFLSLAAILLFLPINLTIEEIFMIIGIPLLILLLIFLFSERNDGKVTDKTWWPPFIGRKELCIRYQESGRIRKKTFALEDLDEEKLLRILKVEGYPSSLLQVNRHKKTGFL